MLDSGVECPPRPLGVAGSSSAVPYGEHVYDQRLVLDLPPYVNRFEFGLLGIIKLFSHETVRIGRASITIGMRRVKTTGQVMGAD